MSVQPADGEPWMTEGTDPQPTAPLTMSGAHEKMLRRIVAGGTGLYSENVRELLWEVDALRAALADAERRLAEVEAALCVMADADHAIDVYAAFAKARALLAPPGEGEP